MMKVDEIKSYITFSARSLFKRKLRSWLTIIGIFIGIAAIVALISLGQGLQDAINSQFELLGTDKIIVTPGGPFGALSVGSGPKSTKITTDEVDAVKKVKGVELASYSGIKMGRIEFENRQRYTFVFRIVLDRSAVIFEEVGSLKAIAGRRLREEDKYKVQVGYLYANTTNYFPKKMRPGDSIKIEGITFEVVGISKKIGNSQDDTQVYMNIDTFDEIYGTKGAYDYIFLKVAEGSDVKKVADDIKKTLRKKRNEEEGKETFNVQTSEQLVQSFKTILDIVQAVLIAIAAISLMVGGVGIMNTMYTAVLERTSEIGVMKAIGAKNIQILLLFLFESGFIGIVGGIIGVLLGIGLSQIAAFAAGQALGTDLIKASFSPALIAGALGFSFLAGCASGVLPAIQASKMKPVDALRK